jgi:hypothetical protein
MADTKKPEPVSQKSETKAEEPEKVEKKESKKLVVRLLADYWDRDGVRHSASWVDENGETRETGALIELDAVEARALVKTSGAERGDDF